MGLMLHYLTQPKVGDLCLVCMLTRTKQDVTYVWGENADQLLTCDEGGTWGERGGRDTDQVLDQNG